MARKNALAAALMLAASTLSACVTTGTTSPVDQLARNDIVKSTVIGAGGGAAAGCVIAEIAGANCGKGAAIGAAVGAAGGLAVGAIAADRRKTYTTEAAYLDTEIAATTTAVETKSAQLQHANAELKDTQTAVAALEAKHRKNINVSAEARTEIAALQTKIKDYNDTLATYQQSIQYLDEIAKTSQPKPGEDPAALKIRQAKLQEKKTDLQKQYAELTGIRDKTLVAVNKLERVAGSAS